MPRRLVHHSHETNHPQRPPCIPVYLNTQFRLWLEHIWEPGTSTTSPSKGGPKQGASASPAALINITVYTQLSLSRLDQLEQQCLSWKGAPLSAAVYLPLLLQQQPDASRGGGAGGGDASGGGGSGGGDWRHSKPGMVAPDWYSPSGPTLQLPQHLRDAVAAAVARLDALVER